MWGCCRKGTKGGLPEGAKSGAEGDKNGGGKEEIGRGRNESGFSLHKQPRPTLSHRHRSWASHGSSNIVLGWQSIWDPHPMSEAEDGRKDSIWGRRAQGGWGALHAISIGRVGEGC